MMHRLPTSPLPLLLSLSLLLLLLLPHLSPISAQSDRVSSRHSFEPPFGRMIPNWNAGAGAFVNTSFVRLTPAKQSRTGFIWNQFPVTMTDWQATVEFSVSGLRNLGGDGFAIWFVERAEMLGAVYGSTDYWTGLGIMFDTFNNDNIGSSPLISAVYNDGTQRFDYASDGASQALQTCTFDFRNHAQPTAARIRYEQKKLTVEIAITRDANDEHLFRPCISVDFLELGTDKYFGVTAHTGDVADNHDVVSFVVSDLTPSDVDLTKVRETYAAALQDQHAQASHQEMNQQDFQHTVLTMLSQMQEEINLIQMTDLHISDWIYLQEEKAGLVGVAGVRPGGADPLPSGRIPPPGQQQQQQAAAPLTAAPEFTALVQAGEQQRQSLDAISDAQSNLLREVRGLQTTINAVSRGPAGAGGGGGQQLGASIDPQLGERVRQTADGVQALSKKVEEQVAQVKQELTRIQSTLQGVANAGGVGGGGGGGAGGGQMGWIPYLMISFTTFCVASLTWHTFTQHMKNQRYKMI